MSDDPRRTGFCTPRCYRVCQCSRWPGMLDRWGNPVNHSGATQWWLSGGIAAANCIAAYHPKGAASLAASYSNLANPGTYDAAAGIAPALAAGGWDFDGAASYLDTGIVHAAITWSVFVQFTAAATGGGNWAMFGSFNGVNNAFLIQYTATPEIVCYNGQPNAGNAVHMVAGNYGLAGLTPYRNGVAEAVVCGGGGGGSGISCYIGALNLTGAPAQYHDITIAALAIYDTTITGPQITALTAAMAAL